MENEVFESELKQLSVLCERTESTDLFNSSYEELIKKVKGGPEQFQRAERMKKLLMLQAGFLAREWLRAKRIMGMV